MMNSVLQNWYFLKTLYFKSNSKNKFKLGKNPSIIRRSSQFNRRIIMKKDKEYALFKGDEISLVVTRYKFRVRVKEIKNPDECQNYLFYTNKIASQPDGDFIDTIHTKWFGDYEKLEVLHGYIQWLFPLFESNGFNALAKRLKHAEAALMREDLEVAKRFLKSYKLMLDFYGLELLDEETGKIGRSSKWEQRYHNLDNHLHNNLRISKKFFSI